MDQIQIVNTKWKLVIDNIDDELGVHNDSLGNIDRKDKIESGFHMWGEAELKYLVESERRDYESVIRCLIGVRKAQDNWIKELQEAFDDVMQEEYQDKIVTRPSPPQQIVAPVPSPVIPSPIQEMPSVFEEAPQDDYIASTMEKLELERNRPKEKGKEPLLVPPRKHTKEEKIELIREVYISLPKEKRTTSKIASITGMSRSTIYHYIVREMGLKFHGAFRGERKKDKESDKKVMEDNA